MKDIFRIMLCVFLALNALSSVSCFLSIDATLGSSRRKTKKLFLESSSKQDDGNISCDVAIFGGGFGGLYTALALTTEFRRKQQDPFSQSQPKKLEIVLVDPSDQFVFLPLLYDLTVGTASEQEVCPFYKDILRGTGIRHVKAKLDCISGTKRGSSSSLSHEADITLTQSGSHQKLAFKSAVLAVGATPESILDRVPGAANLTQPFYTRKHALETKKLLENLERSKEPSLIAVIGGGYGGVELAACVKRRIPSSTVTLLTRAPPLEGTSAEPLVDQALAKLGVDVELCSVQSIQKLGDDLGPSIQVRCTPTRNAATESGSLGAQNDHCKILDAVLWTAGSGPAYPVSTIGNKENLLGLEHVPSSGRLRVDKTLRCFWGKDEITDETQPTIWALGDCAEMVGSTGPAVPKTASAAIQQADVVANNILNNILSTSSSPQSFEFQDMGMLMNLGGPNAAVLAPIQDSVFKPVFTPILDISRIGLNVADKVFTEVVSNSPLLKSTGLKTPSETLGLSFGGYGLGVDAESTPGTLAGTLAGAARRAVYAVRMPTNQQRVYAAASAAISTATALAKEARDKNQEE